MNWLKRLDEECVLPGVVRGEDKDSIAQVTANETIVVPKSEIDQRKASEHGRRRPRRWLRTTRTYSVREQVRLPARYSRGPANYPA